MFKNVTIYFATGLILVGLVFANSDVENLFNQYLQVENKEDGINLLKEIADTSPKSAYGLYAQGYILINENPNDLKKALRFYSKAIKSNPELYVVYVERGNIYVKLNKPKKAIENYSLAIGYNENYSDAYSKRGVLYTMTGNVIKGILDLKKAMKLNPNDVEAHYNYGLILSIMEDPIKALPYFSKAIALDPTEPEVYLNRGNLYYQMGKTGTATVFAELK
ncbi:MAG: tetratricopeptide repeat protein [Endomicrobiales bacterium]|nr:tetratricopeptide repeat protein [Endomicrobiales bacterium]